MRLFTTFLAFLALASCQQSHEEVQDTLRLNMRDDPVSFDPRVVQSIKDLTLARHLYEGLMRLDEHHTPTCALAKSVDISDDHLTYTFHLRTAQWSDGTPIQARDFATSWKEVLTPALASNYTYLLDPIKDARRVRLKECSVEELGIDVVDSHTLVVHLEKPTPYFLELTAFPTYFPMREGLSSGPFLLDKWEPQSSLHLKKNTSYWDADNVTLEAIAFTILDDNNTESLLYAQGELDWLGQPVSNNIATELLARMKEEGKLSSYPIAGTFWLKYNVEAKPFDDPLIRTAFAYAIDRQALITHILGGFQKPATGPVPPTMPLTETPYFADADYTQAKELFESYLEKNGLTRPSFPPVTLSYTQTERTAKIVQFIQQQWEKTFDIPITLEGSENQVYRNRTKQGAYQVGTGEWIADFNDPIAFLEIFQSCGINDTRWEDPTYIALLTASTFETDPTTRTQLLQQAESYLITQMPIAPLYHYSFDYLKSDRITGVLLSPLGSADFTRATVH